jgi:hypothetical protein
MEIILNVTITNYSKKEKEKKMVVVKLGFRVVGAFVHFKV